MKAVQFAKFGDASMLESVEKDRPSLSSGQVLIRAASAGLNPIDWKTRKGMGFVAKQISDRLPWVPGFDIAGIIEEVAPDVTDFKPGDHVMGICGFQTDGGGYAQLVRATAAHIVHCPAAIDLKTAGAIPLAALTAWQALFRTGNLRKGEIVLIHAAAGGVGHFAVQFAKWKGANIIATASEKNRDFLKSFGVDEVIDYKSQKFTEECENIDFILDGVGGQIGIDSLKVLRPGGTLVTLPTLSAPQIIEAAKGTHYIVKGMTMEPLAGDLAEIAALVSEKKVKVDIEKAFTLEEAVEAHTLLEKGSVRGKLIFNP